MELTKVQIGNFDGKNWSTWKYKVCILLRSFPGAFDVVEGNLQKPKELEAGASQENKAKYERDLASFTKADSNALLVITTNMTEEILQKVMRFSNARDVWLELHRMYDGASEDKAYDLCLEFFSYQKDPSDDISSHMSKLKNLWNSLKLEVSKETKNNTNLPELFLICKILGTLSEEYFSFKSSWMLMGNSERTVENLTTQLCAYEKALNGRNTNNSGEALAVKSEIRSRGQNSGLKLSQGKKEKPIVCHYCKITGHKVKQCYKWKSDGRPAKPTRPSNHNRTDKRDSGENVTLLSVCHVNSPNVPDNGTCWYVDNGATNHITSRDDLFKTFEPFLVKHSVTTANGETICAQGKGTVEVEATVNGKRERLDLVDVWYVPSIKKNLFSVLATQDLHPNSEFVSTTETCYLKVNGQVKLLGTRSRRGGLYKLNVENVRPENAIQINSLTSDENLLQLYHERLGHQNKRHVKTLIERDLGVKLKLDSELCEGCIYGKSHRLKFGTRERATQPGELIHTDVCGPFMNSMSGYRYFVLFKDDFSRYREVYFMKHKSDVAEKLKLFLAESKTAGKVVKEILSDNGGEFDNGYVRKILQEHGIKQRLTMPYTPEQNGCSERDNRTLVETARAMMHAHENIPQGLWAEMINSAAYILNRTGPSSQPDKSPFELWTGKKASLKHLRIIGCTCYAHVPKPKRKKMDKKAVKGILIGYDNNDGYRIWCKENSTLIRSRDVKFQETPLLQENPISLTPKSSVTINMPVTLENEENTEETESDGEMGEHNDDNQGSKYNLRNRRDVQKPKKLDDYVILAESNVTDTKEPEYYKEAINSDYQEEWKIAMDDEMRAHKTNQTWNLENLPAGKRCIPCKWIYKVKTKPNGAIERFKARLVIKGYSQRKGEDYFETFSPVARLGTIRALLSVAANEKMKLRQFDVSTAFLYGKLEETIYMKQPEGYDDGSGRVCRLNKSLYGLKQAPRCWNNRFGNFLINLGLVRSKADPCLFIKKEGAKKLLVALYVDDGLVASTDSGMLEDFMTRLREEFKITEKEASYFLGFEIKQREDGSITVSQAAYTKKLLKRFGMDECKPSPTPIIKDEESDSNKIQSEEKKNFPYRECVGGLMYLMVGTRPDIAYAVGKASRSLENPTFEDWIKVKRILRYLKGTADYFLEYKNKYEAGFLECYSDADHAGDSSTGRSTSGAVCMYSGAAISWFSVRQTSVAISSTEAEIVAASEACKEIMWLTRLLKEITVLKNRPILKIDNISAKYLAENPESHRRTKHIRTRHFYVRELVSEDEIEVQHVPTEFQLADCLTKPLHKPKLKTMCDAVGLKSQIQNEGKC